MSSLTEHAGTAGSCLADDALTQETPVQGRLNSPAQVLFASMIGTTIEFFDFYIYATAAVLVFPQLFFPASDPTSSVLQSLATLPDLPWAWFAVALAMMAIVAVFAANQLNAFIYFRF